eukprot:CAMPEP_0116951180 /NCGR_PEP_ID=MMETSP0467-20121206/39954_1 /TAXON_ID=283647 /ORGANISM="Mesodinium pulex, Strain SPMC105" /LENGTH=63 /DNA_ID=CAMNT_0004636153 /DNA_START=622 /DNA_END=813 /DNA_ORIENTATION=+
MEMDKNGDGIIQTNEMMMYLEKVTGSDEEIKEIVHEIDVNKDMKISYDEFLAVVNVNKPVVED